MEILSRRRKISEDKNHCPDYFLRLAFVKI